MGGVHPKPPGGAMDARASRCDILAITDRADRYELDFYGWTLAQADALRRRSANERFVNPEPGRISPLRTLVDLGERRRRYGEHSKQQKPSNRIYVLLKYRDRVSGQFYHIKRQITERVILEDRRKQLDMFPCF